jgi:asparagine synthase (glutamine-hydrolysing)
MGVWLSGGIDSSTILHYASAVSSKRLKTYSISFRGRSFDESTYIRQVSSHYGTDHAELDLNPGEDLSDAIEEFAYYSDEPSADAGALPVWFLAKLSKTGTTVALSGEGADELFGGYLTHRADRLASQVRRLPASILRLVLDRVRHWPVSDDKIGFDYKVTRFLEGCLLSADRGHIHWNGTFSEAQKRSMLRLPLPGALGDLLSEIGDLSATKDDLVRFLWFDQKYFLADDIFGQVRQNEHGSFSGSAAAISRSSNRRVCCHVTGWTQDAGCLSKIHTQTINEGEVAEIDSSTQDGGL